MTTNWCQDAIPLGFITSLSGNQKRQYGVHWKKRCSCEKRLRVQTDTVLFSKTRVSAWYSIQSCCQSQPKQEKNTSWEQDQCSNIPMEQSETSKTHSTKIDKNNSSTSPMFTVKRQKRYISVRNKRQDLDSQHRTLFTRGMEELKRKNTKVARQLFKQCAESHEVSLDLRGKSFLSWARLESQQGNWEEARNIFRKGMETDTCNKHLLHAWAVLEERCGQIDRARQLFQQCIDIDPSDGISWQSYALLEERQGNTEKAEELFKEGLERDPHNHYLLQAWAVLLSRKGQWKQAIDLFQRATEIEPNYYQAWQAMAVAHGKLGNREDAKECFQVAIQLNPSSVPSYQAYALFEAEDGNYEHARMLFQKGSELDPSHAPIFHAWAILEESLGNIEKARELFEKGFYYSPQSLAMLRGWTRMEQRLGHLPNTTEWKITDQSPIEMTGLGEKLRILGKMVERRSEADVRMVLEWLSKKSKNDQYLRELVQQKGIQEWKNIFQWAERRSSEDIRSFMKWFNDRYEEDRQVAAFILGWQLPPRRKEQLIPEWSFIGQVPKTLTQGDELCYYQSNSNIDYCRCVYFLGGFVNHLSNRMAQLTALIGLSAILMFLSLHLGVLNMPTESVLVTVPEPTGVDAPILQGDLVRCLVSTNQ
eukprot:jgi/Galph1/3931/GphlegSOOS_G2597.1